MNITESFLRRQEGKPIPKRISHSIGNGLQLRISPLGKMTFCFRFTFDQKQQLMDIGTYPMISLNEARLKASELTLSVKRGVNIKKTSVSLHRVTVEEIYSEWIDTIYSQEHTVQRIALKQNQFKKHIPLLIKNMAADDLTPSQFETMIFAIKPVAPSAAIEILMYMKPAFNRAVRNGTIARNVPALFRKEDFKLSQGLPDQRHFSETEFVEFFDKINAPAFSSAKAAYLKILLLTGCRKNELRLAKYTDFERNISGIDCWEVPQENHKNGERFQAPIIRSMTSSLREQVAIMRDAFPYTYFYGNPRFNEPRAYNFCTRYAQQVGMTQSFTLKSLRHSYITWASPLMDDRARKRSSGHAFEGMERIYLHNLFLKEMKIGLENWQDFLIEHGMNGPVKKVLYFDQQRS